METRVCYFLANENPCLCRHTALEHGEKRNVGSPAHPGGEINFKQKEKNCLKPSIRPSAVLQAGTHGVRNQFLILLVCKRA